jgi:1-acyl-sn-glycerol-3-phosphate acyltransferase
LKAILGVTRLVLLCLLLVAMYSFYLLKTIFIKHTVESGFKLRRRFVARAIKILGIKIDVLGKPIKEKPVLYVINHRSLVDPVIISAFIDVFFVSKAEVSSYPVLGAGAQKTGVIFVKRDSKSSRSATLNAISETFSKGENIGIFPEGTTNLYKLTKQYRLGSFNIAAELNVPVVPIVLEYKDHKDLWNRSNMLVQFIKQFGAWKTHTKVIIGDPISAGSGIELLEQSQKITDDTLEKIHVDWSTMQFEGLREPLKS